MRWVRGTGRIADKKMAVVKGLGGETFKFNGFTVEAVQGHHDNEGTMRWASNYPAALAIRDASPKTRTMDVIYRTPVCFNTASKEMVIGW